MGTRKLGVAMAGVVLALSACAGQDPGQSSAAHNQADVDFAVGMIPHHRQALEMSELAEDRAADPEVKELAEDIAAAQGPEIEQMSAWLDEWGVDVPENDGGHSGAGHDGGAGQLMPGMMTGQQMEQLAETSGPAWDQLYLRAMIEHHRGAIEMAADEEANGRHPGALRLAEEIQRTQQAEIQRMEQLLD